MEESLGILIRRRAWSDTSWIVTWVTRDHGKVSTIARGARRPSSPHAGKLDLFFTAEIAFAVSRKSTLHTLREVRLVEPFDAASVPPANVFLAGYFAEVTDLATQPGAPVEAVFGLLVRAFGHLRKCPASRRALEHYESELCRALGIHGRAPLASLESYCGRIPGSRQTALALMP